MCICDVSSLFCNVIYNIIYIIYDEHDTGHSRHTGNSTDLWLNKIGKKKKKKEGNFIGVGHKHM